MAALFPALAFPVFAFAADHPIGDSPVYQYSARPQSRGYDGAVVRIDSIITPRRRRAPYIVTVFNPCQMLTQLPDSPGDPAAKRIVIRVADTVPASLLSRGKIVVLSWDIKMVRAKPGGIESKSMRLGRMRRIRGATAGERAAFLHPTCGE